MKSKVKRWWGLIFAGALFFNMGIGSGATKVVAEIKNTEFLTYFNYQDIDKQAVASGYTENGMQIDFSGKAYGIYTNYTRVTDGNSLSVDFVYPRYTQETTGKDNCVLNEGAVTAKNIGELSMPIIGKKADGSKVYARLYFHMSNYASLGVVRGGLISSASISNWNYLVGDGKTVELYGPPAVGNEFSIEFNMTEGFKTKLNSGNGTATAPMYTGENLAKVLAYFDGVTEMKIGFANATAAAGSVYVTETNGTDLKAAGICVEQRTKRQTLGEVFDRATIAVKRANKDGVGLYTVEDYTLGNTEPLTLADRKIEIRYGEHRQEIALEYADFKMIKGAEMRLKGKSGLRFTAKILEADYAALCEKFGAENVSLGMRIIRDGNAYADVLALNTIRGEGYIAFSGVVTDIAENGHSLLTYRACAYLDVKTDGGETVRYYADYNANESSAESLAKEMLAGGEYSEFEEILKKYIGEGNA